MPVVARVYQNTKVVHITAHDPLGVIADLPPDKYVVFAKVQIANNDPAMEVAVQCLVTLDTAKDEAFTMLAPRGTGGGSESVALNCAIDLSGGGGPYTARFEVSGGTSGALAIGATLTVMSVDELYVNLEQPEPVHPYYGGYGYWGSYYGGQGG